MRTLGLFLALALAAPAAAGDLVKYRTPDGSIGYAAPQNVPPGAEVLREGPPAGHVTRSGEARRPHYLPDEEPEAGEGAAPAARAEEAPSARDVWQAKKEEAEDAVREARSRLTQARAAASELRCGRRYEDRACPDAREDIHRWIAEVEEAEEYLAEGLAEECRRDWDCLPGYLRD